MMKQFTAIVAICLLMSSCSVVHTVKPIERVSMVQPRVSINIPAMPLEPVRIEVTTISQPELNCLAKGIYYEAGGEPESGKKAVGFVIMNRTVDGKYPSTICEVIKQTVTIHNKRFCQFSWYCQSGQAKLNRVLSSTSYAESLDVASRILNKLVDNNVPGAILFHVTRLDHHSKHTQVIAKFGHQTFYKEI